MNRFYSTIILLSLVGFICYVPAIQAEENSFTQKDRELLIRLDERLNQIDKRFEQIDKRFEQVDKRFEQVDKRFEELRQDMNKRFEQLMNFMWILAGIFTSLVVAIIAFAFWDRRTMLREMKNEIEKEGSLQNLIIAIRKYAKNNKELADALKSVNLL